MQRDPKPDNIIDLYPERRANCELPPTGEGTYPEMFSKSLRLHLQKNARDADLAYGPIAERVPRWAIAIVLLALAYLLYYL